MNLIAGARVEGDAEAFAAVDPATARRTWEGRAASADQVSAAVAAAADAFVGWRRTPLADRVSVAQRFAELIRDHTEELASTITGETGKPLWEARTEPAAMAAKVAISIEAQATRAGIEERELAGGIRSVTRHRANGVMAVFGPYNFPGHLPNGHIVPALLAGDTVVFKPSELAPGTADATARLWEEAGLPPGVLNVVHGGGDTGRALAGHPDIDGILFTGSVATGRLLHAQAAGRPELLLALELGGNNPLIVREGVDTAAAVVTVVQSAFLSAGQRCSCTRRLLVPDGPWGDELVTQLALVTEGLEPGDPRGEPQPFLGPVVGSRAADALARAWDDLVELGGRPIVPLLRGAPDTGYVSPGVVDLTGVDGVPDEEHFGPLLSVYRYDGLDQAIELANDTEFGLSAGILTADRAEYERVLDEVEAGVINWNRPTTGASSGAPFGGVGGSGNHRPSAFYAADYVAHPIASLEADALTMPDTLPPGLELG
jgi:succinylglutamic semialdehyde dehydrogenase